MKKFILLFLVSVILFSCDSPKKALQRGSYDQACMMAIKKLQKKPSDIESAEIFTVAYQKANQADIDRVEFLKLSGEQNAWDEIYSIYNRLDRRQTQAETVLPLRTGGKTVDFEHINYNEMIVDAKNSAADFHYSKGIELLNGDRNDARKAYDHLVQARQYSSQYPDLEKRIQESKDKGTTYVFLTPLNKTYAHLSPEFLGGLLDFGMNQLDDNWKRFFNSPTREYFDYNIFVTINSVYVSPDDTKETKETIKKEVRDGWIYEYDSKGNVKRDSLGNDIKTPKYKTVSCTITRKLQKKFASIKCNIEIQDNLGKRIVASIPTEGQANFEYLSSFANGDLNALDEETRKSVGKSPISYPNDLEMLDFAADKLKPKIIEAIKQNKNYIK